MRGPRPALRAASAIVLALLALTPGARAADAGAYTLTETYIESSDGVRLHAFVYRPDPAPASMPVILTVTPYAGTGGNFVNFATDPLSPEPPLLGSPTPAPGGLAERLLGLGYAYVVVSLRGYGGSGGCLDFGGAGEQADVAASIEWAASQPWSGGDVGMIGHSYPGQTGLMGIASRLPALRAVVAGAPPAGYHNLYTNRVANLPSAHFYPAVYALSDLFAPSLLSPTEQHTNAASGSVADPACPATAVATSVEREQSAPYWVERDLVPKLVGTTVPTLLTQGFNDYQVRPNAITEIWRSLAGPRRLVLGPYDHGIEEADGSWDDEVVAWFDRHVRGMPGSDAPPVRVQCVDGSWREEADWPPGGTVERAVSILAGSYLDVPGNDGETGPPALWPIDPPMRNGQGSWTFTPPLASPSHVAGVPRVVADVGTVVPDVNVIALVYDVDEDGDAQLVTRGAAFAGATAAGFDLYPADWRFAPGHRIGLLLTAADDLWFEPSATGTAATIRGGSLLLPELAVAGPALEHGPFVPRTQHPPFRVDAETIAERTSE